MVNKHSDDTKVKGKKTIQHFVMGEFLVVCSKLHLLLANYTKSVFLTDWTNMFHEICLFEIMYVNLQNLLIF